MAETTTPLGAIKGVDLDGCERYAAIRYAQPPVGYLRFRAPQPVEPWPGVYDATAFGPSAPQPAPLTGSLIAVGDLRTDEDCLFLNVYTPKADSRLRPVMVWIHGGAYTIGSGDMYDGRSFARRGDVVVVTFNYRLGALGWLALDHLDPTLAGSGNNGLRDQIQALRWVRGNISSFGGDPDNVTIFGESAGGGSVAALLAAPEADGLYHKAIIQSGSVAIAPSYKPDFLTAALLSALGEPHGGIDTLRRAEATRLVEAQTDVGSLTRLGHDRDNAIDGSGAGFRPSVDGVVVRATPAQAITARGNRSVPLLIGSNEDEGTLFSMLLSADISDEEVITALPETIVDRRALAEGYAARSTGRRLIVDLMTDAIFLIPTLRLADAQAAAGAPVWVYLFRWKTPVFAGFLGATHGLELPFVWDQIDAPLWRPFVGEQPPEALAVAMQDAWIAFARASDPNTPGAIVWPRYDASRRSTLELDDTIKVADDPSRDVRDLWYRASVPT
jgi:para-nitrobenzyl esterase